MDVSYIDCGYVIVSVDSENNKKCKLKISANNQSYLYDLNNDNVVVPLQMGNGNYITQLFQNVVGNRYAECGYITFTVNLSDNNAPFTHPNQYVDYDNDIINIASKLSSVKDIFSYIEKHFDYDYVYAITVKKGALPNIKRLLSLHTGICQDFAALTVALLRIKCIPSKLCIGEADNHPHAWVEYMKDDHWKLYDPTAKIQHLTIKNYKKEREY